MKGNYLHTSVLSPFKLPGVNRMRLTKKLKRGRVLKIEIGNLPYDKRNTNDTIVAN